MPQPQLHSSCSTIILIAAHLEVFKVNVREAAHPQVEVVSCQHLQQLVGQDRGQAAPDRVHTVLTGELLQPELPYETNIVCPIVIARGREREREREV